MDLVTGPPLPARTPLRKVSTLEVEYDEIDDLVRDGRFEGHVSRVGVQIIVAFRNRAERENVCML